MKIMESFLWAALCYISVEKIHAVATTGHGGDSSLGETQDEDPSVLGHVFQPSPGADSKTKENTNLTMKAVSDIERKIRAGVFKASIATNKANFKGEMIVFVEGKEKTYSYTYEGTYSSSSGGAGKLQIFDGGTLIHTDQKVGIDRVPVNN